MYETLQVIKEDRLVRLVLNRPQAMNAMDEKLMQELVNAFTQLHDDEEVQVVILEGAGKTFSAGGDIKKMLDPTEPMNMELVMEIVGELAKKLYTLPQLTIAAVHGAAAGLGFSVALGCDVLIAEEDSKLAMNFIGIGLVPDGAGHFFLKERMGSHAAKQHIWAGEVLTSQQAKEKGLIDQIVPTGKVQEVSQHVARQFLAAPTQAMLATKKILHDAKINELEAIIQGESKAQVAMRQTTDHAEGIRAFVEKRKPVFSGK